MADQAILAFEKLTERNASLFDPFRDENGHLSRIVNLHLVLPEFQNLFLDNRALPILNYIFGAKPALYTTLYFQRGSQQDIHRDTPFFSTVPNYYFVGFWMALEAATEDNGALRIVRGGHRCEEPDLEALARVKYSDISQIDPMDSELWERYQTHVLNDCLARGLKVETLAVPGERGNSYLASAASSRRHANQG